MIDIQLVSRRFEKASASYRQCATVQKRMAVFLSSQLQKQIALDPALADKALDILEIGCGTGFLTEAFLPHVKTNLYIGNDLYPSAQQHIESLAQINANHPTFIVGDASQIKLNHTVDVVVGASVLQWISQPQKLFENLYHQINQHGLLGLSGFSLNHYQEVKAITGTGLDYPTPSALLKLASGKFNLRFQHTKIMQLFFDHPKDILQHMKHTGVNAVVSKPWGRQNIRHFVTAYEAFKTHQGYPLTYHPLFVILQKAE